MDEFSALILTARNKGKKSKRVNSGMKAVEICIDRVWNDKLLEIAADKKMPKEVRKEAANRMIEKYMINGWYNDLIEMGKNKKLLWTSRKKAKKAVKVAALNKIGEYAGKRSYISLLRIIMDRKLPKSVRKTAKAIANDILYGRQQAVSSDSWQQSDCDRTIRPPQRFLDGLRQKEARGFGKNLKRLRWPMKT